MYTYNMVLSVELGLGEAKDHSLFIAQWMNESINERVSGWIDARITLNYTKT